MGQICGPKKTIDEIEGSVIENKSGESVAEVKKALTAEVESVNQQVQKEIEQLVDDVSEKNKELKQKYLFKIHNEQESDEKELEKELNEYADEAIKKELAEIANMVEVGKLTVKECTDKAIEKNEEKKKGYEQVKKDADSTLEKLLENAKKDMYAKVDDL